MIDNTGFQQGSFGGNVKKNSISADAQQDRGHLRIIGKVVGRGGDKTNLMGYVIMDTRTEQFRPYSVEQTYTLLAKIKFINAEIKNGVIKNTECSMDRLPSFDMSMTPLDKGGITIISQIVTGDKVVGYRAMDQNGSIAEVTEKDLIALNNKGIDIINAKVVTKDNKKFISAITGHFPIVNKKRSNNLTEKHKKNTVPLTAAQKQRFEQHRNKIVDKWLKQTFSKLMDYRVKYFNGCSSLRLYENCPKTRMSKGMNLYKDINIVYNEIIPTLKLSQKDKDVLEAIKNYCRASNNIGMNMKMTADEQIQVGALSQIILLVPGYYDKLLKKIGNKYSGKPSEILTKIKDKGLLLDITVDFLKDLKKYKNVKAVKERVPFHTTEFKSAQQAAQVGLAICKFNDGYSFETETGSKLHLKFIGKYTPDYDELMQYATCLGDMVCICAVDKILSGAYDYLNQRGYYNVNDVSKSALVNKAEIMLALLSIKNPTLCSKYLAARSKDGNGEILVGMLPGFDPEYPAEYEFSKEANLYYESGFNAYYISDLEYERNRVAKKYRNDDIYYIRGCGPHAKAINTKLLSELAPVVLMITSASCEPDKVENLLTNLRFF